MMGKGKFHYASSMVFSCFILQMVMVVGQQSVPLMLGDIAETLQISATEAGGLTGAFSLFYGSLGFVWGFVSDKIGVRKVLMISLACVTAGLLLFGLFVFFSAVLGLYRFGDALSRMHAAAVGDALGIFCILAGLMVLHGWSLSGAKTLLVFLFLWLTSPVSSHLIAEMEVMTVPEIEKECEVEER